jgi:hypothetical protein
MNKNNSRKIVTNEQLLQKIESISSNLSGKIEAVNSSVDRLAESTAIGFAGVDRRFNEVALRFDNVEHRLDKVESRLDGVEIKLYEVEGKIDKLGGQFDTLTGEVGATKIVQNRRIDILEDKMQVVYPH